MDLIHEKFELSQLPAVTQKLIGILIEEAKDQKRATIIALNGDLGAGKTTLVKELARQIGVVGSVTSPTFVVMRKYESSHPVFKILVHVDAYRFESEAEAAPLQFHELCSQSDVLFCIEWPSRLPQFIASVSTITIDLLLGEHEDERIITVTKK